MSKKLPSKKTHRRALKYRGTECLNCGHPLDLSDVYCAYCAQLNSTKKVSYKDFIEEFLSSIISYDSRFSKTLFTLLFRPGKITRDFMAGKRMRFANPFRFYLSVSIIFFIIWGSVHNFDEMRLREPEAVTDVKENGVKLAVNDIPVENKEALDSLLIESDLGAFYQNDSLQFNFPKKDSIVSYKDVYLSEDSLQKLTTFKGLGKRYRIYKRFYKETQIKVPTQALDSLKHTATRYHKWVYKKAIDINDLDTNIGDVMKYFGKQLPFIFFFFLPIFALFIRLIYIRRRHFTYTAHLIFLFHVQTLFFVVYGLALLINTSFNIEWASAVAVLLFLLYLFLAMRTFYQQGFFKTAFKFLILNAIFSVLSAAAVIIAFLFSFATY